MITTIGKAFEHKDGMAIKTTRPPAENLSDTVTVIWQDKRTISPEQRRKAFALIGEIMAWDGLRGKNEQDRLHAQLKGKFLIRCMDDLTAEAIRTFSLHDCSMDTARLYITFLIDMIIDQGIPTKESLISLADDIEAYVYKCSISQKCCVCGKKAGVHHVDKVGMGRDRDFINHIGMLHLPLCWGVNSHHQEVEHIGNAAFLEKYHLPAIPIDERIARIYKLRRQAK